MSPEQGGRPDASMTLINEMLLRPLDPSYAAAAQRREKSGLPPATGHRGPMLVIVAILIGGLLATSALALRPPTSSASTIKSDLVGRIEVRRAHVDAQARLIDTVRNEINAAQAAALSRQSQTGLAAELSRLELAAGTLPVTGPGLVITLDDAPAQADPKQPGADPQAGTGTEQGIVVASDVQLIVNGLWQAGAEAISVNGHRLTSRAAMRSAGAAILVDSRPLVRPYAITAIGDPGSLSVEFADNDGGSYLQMLKSNFKIRGDINERDPVVVPGTPALSLQEAKPVQSAVTKRTDTAPSAGTASKSAPQTTETPP